MTNLKRLEQNRFLVFGRAGMDIYPDPPGTRTKEAQNFFACLGGSAANIAVALTRHGGKADLVTTVSDDAVGQFVLNQLDHYGIGRDKVKRLDGECRTSLAVVESRVEDHQSVIYRNNAADFQVEMEDLDGIDFSSYGAFIATGTNLASEPSRATTFAAAQKARQLGLPVIFDVDYRPYSWASNEFAAQTYDQFAALCDVIIGNDEEFGVMAGRYEEGESYAQRLVANGLSIAVYKMGHKGSKTFTQSTHFATGIYPVQALKPTGAGDAFMGSFVASLAHGDALQRAVERGSAAAAYVVARVGCAPAMPNTEQLDEFIQNHSGLTAA